MNRLLTEAVVIVIFLFPALLLYFKGRSRETAALDKKGGGVADGKASVPSSVLKAALIVSFFLIPAYFHSDSSYSFYPGNPASIKVAFKHTGKRVVDCDEAGLIKSEGERYREILKGNKGVRMDITKLTGCPRERHPVTVNLTLDGKTILSKSYPATGLKKDMASYVSEEFMLDPGEYSVTATLTESGNPDEPDFTLKEKVTLKPYGIRLIRFDEKRNSLVIE